MVYNRATAINMHHHLVGTITANSSNNGRSSSSTSSLGGADPYGSIGSAIVNGVSANHHHNFDVNLHHSLMNSGNQGRNLRSNGPNVTHHSPIIQSINSHQHQLNHRNRQQHLSGSTAAAAAAMAAINSHFIQHSHLSFNQLNNSSNNHLSQNSHHQHYNASNSHPHHHHPLGSLSSNSSAMSSSSSSPSVSVSPTSLASITPPQHNNLINAIGLGTGFQNHHHHQLTTANNLQQQTNNSNNGSNLQQSQQQNTSRYKTELCRPFEENGTCKYGEKCQFAHGVAELRTLIRHPKYKTEFCRTFHTTGFCPYGPRCHFIHNAKMPTQAASIPFGSYGNLPFGQQASHSASPSTSPVSSTSTANGSASSASSTASSSSISACDKRESLRVLLTFVH